MDVDKKNVDLRLLKKLYDNSFYPATYNIEKNCFEYPYRNSLFYCYPPVGYAKLPKDFWQGLISEWIKEFSDKFGGI